MGHEQGLTPESMKAILDERNRLAKENEELKRNLAAQRSVRHENGRVYFGDDPHPYCGTCYGDTGKKIPLIDLQHSTVFECQKCHALPPKPGAVEHEAANPIRPGDSILKRMR